MCLQERTEEKRKIFELAGGGNKKKPSDLGRPSKPQPKKPTQYLPDIEKKRREPWRAYTGVRQLGNGIDSASCLGGSCVFVVSYRRASEYAQQPVLGHVARKHTEDQA